MASFSQTPPSRGVSRGESWPAYAPPPQPEWVTGARRILSSDNFAFDTTTPDNSAVGADPALSVLDMRRWSAALGAQPVLLRSSCTPQKPRRTPALRRVAHDRRPDDVATFRRSVRRPPGLRTVPEETHTAPVLQPPPPPADDEVQSPLHTHKVSASPCTSTRTCLRGFPHPHTTTATVETRHRRQPTLMETRMTTVYSKGRLHYHPPRLRSGTRF